MALPVNSTLVPRADLAKAFPDVRTQRAVEQALTNARVIQAGPGVTVDLSVDGVATISATFATITRDTRFVGLQSADDDAAAAALTPPVQIGEAYLNGSVLQVRVA